MLAYLMFIYIHGSVTTPSKGATKMTTTSRPPSRDRVILIGQGLWNTVTACYAIIMSILIIFSFNRLYIICLFFNSPLGLYYCLYCFISTLLSGILRQWAGYQGITFLYLPSQSSAEVVDHLYEGNATTSCRLLQEHIKKKKVLVKNVFFSDLLGKFLLHQHDWIYSSAIL
jgi:hypothetical protein